MLPYPDLYTKVTLLKNYVKLPILFFLERKHGLPKKQCLINVQLKASDLPMVVFFIEKMDNMSNYKIQSI